MALCNIDAIEAIERSVLMRVVKKGASDVALQATSSQQTAKLRASCHLVYRLMADITVHFALYLGERLGLDKRYKPNTLRYLQSLKQRPAFQRAMAKQDA